jgi:hypothetical protein
MQPPATFPMNSSPAIVGEWVSGQASPIQVPEIDEKQRRARQERIKRAWAAYRGEFKPPFTEDDGKTATNDCVIVNRCGPAVKVSVDFLFGKDVTMTVDDSEAQDYLDAFWKANRQKKLLKRWATNGSIAGHAFLRIIPSTDPTWPWPRIVVLDPMHVDVITDPDDVDNVLAYVIQYDTGTMEKTVTKRTTIARNDPGKEYMVLGWDSDEEWVIVNQVKYGIGAHALWQLDGDPIPWDWHFAPVIECQNMVNPVEYLGEPDLTEDVIKANEIINFTASNISRILRLYAHPITWGRGFNASQLDRRPDNLVIINDPMGTLANLEMQSDLTSSLNFLGDLRADMDEETGVPEVALGRQSEIPRVVSGVALELLYQTLLQKTTSKQCYYGDALEMLCSAVLEMAGYGANVEVEVHWPNLLPADDVATAQALTALVGIGLSEHTALQEAGYDPDDEAKKKDIENQSKTTLFDRGQGPPVMPQQQIPNQLPPRQNDGGQGVQ